MPISTNRWILNIVTLAGVPVRIHGSFFIFLIWILYQSSGGWIELAVTTLFFLSIFFCVLLHELGHTTVARLYGIKTRDITLYPFGGIALLLAQPKAAQELLIALAGPLVNVFLAGILFSFHSIIGANTHGAVFSQPVLSIISEVVDQLIRTNLLLASFNLIPAIPMDGGRVLRALLEIFQVKSATVISGRISQVCAVAMGLFGIFSGSPILTIISGFVFMGAMEEMVTSRTSAAASGRVARDVMVERAKLYEFSHGTTLSDALMIAMKALQDIFPVVYQERLIGLIPRSILIDAATGDGENQYLSGLMQREFTSIAENLPLIDVIKLANQEQLSSIPVLDERGAFIGIAFPANISDFMVVDTIRTDQKNLQEQIDSDDSF